jgi:hypothetical protein
MGAITLRKKINTLIFQGLDSGEVVAASFDLKDGSISKIIFKQRKVNQND